MDLEKLFDQITVFSELALNVRYDRFLKERNLPRVFVPVATFNQDGVEPDKEFVAIIEGVVYPFFGIAYSIEKIQHNFDLAYEHLIDSSRASVREAQRIANLFVDEARLSRYFFK